MFDPDDYRVRRDQRVDLSKHPTQAKGRPKPAKELERLRRRHVAELDRLQTLLYADNRHALLLVFQAMDAAGKDSAIKHVMSGVNPQGCQVHSFKHPSGEELEHDFLWRAGTRLPERGHIGIFNRSHYEEVLIVRVHRELLAAERLPDADPGKGFWRARYKSIRDFEAHLHHNGTHVLKFFLHVSKEEQRRRLLARLEDPAKHWKFSRSDLQERRSWARYMDAYAECLRRTSTRHAPWFIVPADDKPTAQLIISTIVLDALERLDLAFPKSPERRQELDALRRQLRQG